MHIEWERNFSIKVGVRDGEVTLSANREGLLSLARIFSALAEETAAVISISTHTIPWRKAPLS